MMNKYYLVFFLLVGCFGDQGEKNYELAREAQKNQNFQLALELLDKVVKRENNSPIAISAALDASEISLLNLNDFSKALKYYRYVVLHSEEEKKRYEAQKQIAKIVFENLSDYQQAILEYSRLVDITEKKSDRVYFRKQIAKAYYFLNHFFQAESETEQLISSNVEKDDLYDLLLLKGNIKLATKDNDAAIEIYDRLLNEFPDRAVRDNISLHLAICYEEKKDFARAIEVLDEMRLDYQAPQYIEQKIEVLRKRQSQLPGAHGLRK